jgi:hypothetical protein
MLLAAGGRVKKLTPGGKLTTVAGCGRCNGVHDATRRASGPATSVQLLMTTAPVSANGALYIGAVWHLWKVSHGRIRLMAGAIKFPDSGFSGDGGPAVHARLGLVRGIAVDRKGDVLFSDDTTNRVRKITPGGKITTIVGSGPADGAHDPRPLGDGGPATKATLNSPGGIALDRQGNLFIADYLDNRVRKVTPDGIITTFAGNGSTAFDPPPDGADATAVPIYEPTAIALDRDGNLLVTSASFILRIDPAGKITRVAGNGHYGFSPDGTPALSAALTPGRLAVDPHGTVFFGDGQNRVRKIVG